MSLCHATVTRLGNARGVNKTAETVYLQQLPPAVISIHLGQCASSLVETGVRALEVVEAVARTVENDNAMDVGELEHRLGDLDDDARSGEVPRELGGSAELDGHGAGRGYCCAFVVGEKLEVSTATVGRASQ